ncbi:MAG: hypothetical protein ACK4GN_05130 [Runella sp.]
MKKLYTQYLIVVFFWALATSCKNEKTNDLAPNNAFREEYVSLQDGVLYFSSLEVFHKTLRNFEDKKLLNEWKKSFPNFKSLSDHFQEMVSKDIGLLLKEGKLQEYRYSYTVKKDEKGDNDYVCSIQDKSLASVVNKDGLIQIGNYLYRINDEKMLRTKIQYKSELLQNIQGRNVEIQQVEHSPIKLKKRNNARQTLDEYPGPFYYTPWSGASERRFEPNYWAMQYCWLGYKSTGLSLAHKRKNWWGWGAIDAQDWVGNSNGTWVYSVAESYSLYMNGSNPSSSYEELRKSVSSSTCSGDPQGTVNFTQLQISVTGNDGVRRTFSYPFTANI